MRKTTNSKEKKQTKHTDYQTEQKQTFQYTIGIKFIPKKNGRRFFLSKVEKGIVWICGEKCFIDDAITYNNLLLYHQGRASRLYHDNPQIWEAAKYERKLARQREANRKAMRKKAYAARV
jgi:hypothetical protein